MKQTQATKQVQAAKQDQAQAPTPRPAVDRLDVLDRFVSFLHLIVLLGLSVTFLMTSISYARASSPPQLALTTAPLSLAAGCDGEMAYVKSFTGHCITDAIN